MWRVRVVVLGLVSFHAGCGQLLPLPDDSACVADADCPDAHTCHADGTCRLDTTTCTNDGDCDLQHVCVDGQCALDVDNEVVVTTMDDPNAYTCACSCTVPSNSKVARIELDTCMPLDLNPNLTASTPTDGELQGDCSGRVEDTVQAMARTCGNPNLTCACDAVVAAVPPERSFRAECNTACVGEELADDCSNWDPLAGVKTANHTADTEPVCVAQTADPPVAIPDPLAAVLYGRASTCELDIGNATLTLDDDDPLTPGVHGRVAIWGTPCPGGSCDVTVAWQTRIDPVTFEGFFGLGDVDVDQLTVGGASVPDVVGLDALGDGILPIGQALTSGRGHSDDDDDDDQAIFGHNTRPMAVGVDWTAKRCDLDGQVATLSTDDSTLTVEVDVGGHLANQPPAAAAGDDQTLECEGTSGTEVALDCGDSTDPDDNLVLTQWRYDDRGGELLGNAESSVTTTQALGSRSYHCQVVDAGFQAHEDTVDVVVEDTTDPVVTCGTPAGGTIVPSGVPISFQATAEDVCAGALVPAISNLRCTKLTRSGKTVDKSESCVVSASGDTVTVTNSGGVDTLIGWTASVGDGNGNDASATCGVLVVKKP